ncbi:MAG TPA: XRE family transcriptional regulator [Porphyromonadaceae bacterium]|jgi:transcriptional regulator with XRE-family HTH domain|nr:XRE family transcriptional regulator [Porphyromonadaceae bacterium]HCM21151.1 XRE family transcriptional regulator [Porphyromonadaceae bacterium]
METKNYDNVVHIGRKIERIRRLRGMTQSELANTLGVTRQAVSKMEQTEKMDEERVEEIASALGVTVEGLKKYNEETVLYCTNNFNENCHVSASNIGPINSVENLNHFPLEKIVEFYEKQLEKEREKFESLKKEKE